MLLTYLVSSILIEIRLHKQVHFAFDKSKKRELKYIWGGGHILIMFFIRYNLNVCRILYKQLSMANIR